MKYFNRTLTFTLLAVFLFHANSILALSGEKFITQTPGPGSFAIIENNIPVNIYVDENDYKGLLKAAKDLQSDIKKITSVEPGIVRTTETMGARALIIGTIGRSRVIDELILNKKLDVSQVSGKWESFTIEVVTDPLPGVERGLVIAGSDKRGSIYGCYELSKLAGVSPWYWWADVPVPQKEALYFKNTKIVNGPPKVKYRGIFLNDEEPALGRWAVEKYGGFTHEFYEKVFELILRLKGNYLWPAMWRASFNSDDPINPQLADEYGIVMGTSHHEPMMRAHAEWKKSNGGEWNYETNEEALKIFWADGIKRMGDRESIVTLAMRGDGDMAMSEGTNIKLLEKIVKDQREILGEVTGKDVTTIPQLWALYKEVQDYYSKGMRVPDDVTLLLCDDNWGNVRILPRPGTPPRKGGYGMYYHFDFVGGPRNYKWVNTVSIPRVWEQMNLTYRHGVDRIWLVNVGDLKPMELPISFFLDYAWNPDEWPAEKLPEYTRLWAEQQFGKEHSVEIASILDEYTKFNSRRKPEMIGPDTYSLTNYREADKIVNDYKSLAQRAQKLEAKIPTEYKDSYFELVLHPVLACANLNELHVTTAKNRLYASQRRAAANTLAEKVEKLFRSDKELSYRYNKVIAGGKWNHMMDQTHISYTYWQQPEKDVIPEVEQVDLPESPEMGVAVEGSEKWWSGEAENSPVLPEFDNFNRQSYHIEVFNRSLVPFEYSANTGVSWIKTTPQEDTVEEQQTIKVSIDWAKAPKGTHNESIEITGPYGNSVDVGIIIKNYEKPELKNINGFVEADGYIAIEAEHFTKAVNSDDIKWVTIPGLSRTLSGVITQPVTKGVKNPGTDTPCLEYRMYFHTKGEVKVQTYFSPTRKIYNNEGLHYAVSFDDETPRVINMHEKDTVPDWNYPPVWSEAVGRNIMVITSRHNIPEPGWHVLKYGMVDPAVVLQKIVVDTGGLKPSYLGPPENFYRITK